MHRQPLELVAGEDRTFTLYARDSANAVVDLTGKTIAWRVGRSPSNPASDTSLISKTGSTVTAASGIYTVTLAAADTIDRRGDYWHEAWLDNGGAKSLVTSGRLRILDGLEA